LTVAELNLIGCKHRFDYCLIICADFYKNIP